jgi:hypothetical protein
MALLLPPRRLSSSSCNPSTRSARTDEDDDDEDENDDDNALLLVAAGSIDGTIALVSTGIPTRNQRPQQQTNDDEDINDTSSSETAPIAAPAGTIVQVWGNDDHDGNNSSSRGLETKKKAAFLLPVPMVLAWQPANSTSRSTSTLAVGRWDGHVDVYCYISSSSSSSSSIPALPPPRRFRLNDLMMGSPVRAVTYMTNGHLLIAGNDHGNLCLWDCSRRR